MHVSEDTAGYLMDIIEATRKDHGLTRGSSTRGAINLYRASQAMAAFSGRDYVIPEDVRDLAPSILSHRVGLGTASLAEGEAYLKKIIESVTVPLEQSITG